MEVSRNYLFTQAFAYMLAGIFLLQYDAVFGGIFIGVSFLMLVSQFFFRFIPRAQNFDLAFGGALIVVSIAMVIVELVNHISEIPLVIAIIVWIILVVAVLVYRFVETSRQLSFRHAILGLAALAVALSLAAMVLIIKNTENLWSTPYTWTTLGVLTMSLAFFFDFLRRR